MEAHELAVRENLRILGETLRDDVISLSKALVDMVVELIGSIADDPDLVDLLVASAEGNLTSVGHTLEHDIDPATVDAPLAGIHFARRLAQRGISINVLVRAYRIGHRGVMNWANSVLSQRISDINLTFATWQRLNDVMFTYVDRVSEQVIVAYSDEAQLWLRGTAASLSGRVRAIMRGDRLDVPALEQALGYQLRQHHVGLVLSAPTPTDDIAALVELERITARLAGHITAPRRPLFVPRDESSAFVWLPLGTERQDWSDLASAIQPFVGATSRVALGQPNSGPEGFRTTMNEALTAHSVVLASAGHGPRVVPFEDVAPLAMLTRDSKLARTWAATVLGALAADDEQAAGFRETLRVYLETAGSLRETADRLFVHKNTVSYRVRRAEQLRGKPVTEDRLQLELALLACHWLGPTVLSPPG